MLHASGNLWHHDGKRRGCFERDGVPHIRAEENVLDHSVDTDADGMSSFRDVGTRSFMDLILALQGAPYVMQQRPAPTTTLEDLSFGGSIEHGWHGIAETFGFVGQAGSEQRV